MTLFSHWTGGLGWPQASGLTPRSGLPWYLSHPPLSLKNTVLPLFQPEHVCSSVGGTPGAGAPLPGRLPSPRELPLSLSSRFSGLICTTQALGEHLAAGIRSDRQKSRINYLNYPADSGEPGLTRLLRGRAAAQRVRGICVVQIPGWEPVCGSPWWRGEPGGNKR